MPRLLLSQESLSNSSDLPTALPTAWSQSLTRFSVGGKCFKVSTHQIYEESAYFSERYLAGRPTNAVIVLEGVTASQWGTFLDLLSPRLSTFSASAEFTKAQWVDILTVATLFRFDRFRKMAMYRLGDLLFDPLEAVILGRQAYFSDWVLKAYDILVRREAPITEEESEVIGHLTTVRLFNIRHSLHWELGHCREEAETPPGADANSGTEGAERGEESLESGDDPVAHSEVDDIVRDCLLQKFEEEFAMIEKEEARRHYTEFGDSDDANDEQDGEDDVDKGVDVAPNGGMMLNEEDEEALQEYLNEDDEGEGGRICTPPVPTSSRAAWHLGQRSIDPDSDNDDDRTRVGSQHGEVVDEWSEGDDDGDNDSPANSFSSTERSIDDDDEVADPCVNIVAYHSSPREAGAGILDISFTTISNFWRLGDLGGSILGASPDDDRHSGSTSNMGGVFHSPMSSPSVRARGMAGEDRRRIGALVPSSSAKSRDHAIISSPHPRHLELAARKIDDSDDEECSDAAKVDSTLCLVA